MSDGRVALITGSGKRRVGNAVAAALAQRGYDIALHYNRSAEEARQTAEELERKGTARGRLSGRFGSRGRR